MKRITILISIILLSVSCEKEEYQFPSIGEINAARLQEYATQKNISKALILESFDKELYGWFSPYAQEKFEIEIEKSFLILKTADNNNIVYDLSKMLKFEHPSSMDFLIIYFLK